MIKQRITLKKQSKNNVLAKSTMDAMGWEFDPTKNRDEQIKGLAIRKKGFFVKI